QWRDDGIESGGELRLRIRERELDGLLGAGADTVPRRGLWWGLGWAGEHGDGGSLRYMDLSRGLGGGIRGSESRKIRELDYLEWDSRGSGQFAWGVYGVAHGCVDVPGQHDSSLFRQ